MVELKSRYKRLLTLARFSSNAIHEHGFRFFLASAFVELKKYGLHVFTPESEGVKVRPISEESAYMHWLHAHQITPEIIPAMRMSAQKYVHRPKFTILLLVDEKNKQYLKESFFSIINQVYTNWEIYVSTLVSKEINEMLDAIPNLRIIYNQKIKQTDSKDVCLHSSSDFIIFVKCGNVLTFDALFRIVQILNKNTDADIIYSDEDQLTKDGDRKNPFFKPDWSPHLFLSFDYISNFCAIKGELLRNSLALKDEFAEAKHYELLLRLTENAKKICHVPTVLASIRSSNLEFADNFNQNAQRAISEALARRKIDGKVTAGFLPNTFRVMYSLHKEPKVTIIIPTKDNKELLHRCITSIKNKTSYKNYEIIIIDNNSTKEETLSYLKSLPHTVIKYDSQFNFSKMNNLAVAHATGDYLLFLNDDTAPLEPNWLSEMVSICEQNDIGVVGAKLVHGNNTIQHAGIALLKTGAGFHPLQGKDANSLGYFGFLNVIRDCSAVTGACLLIKKNIFDKIGGFDNNFDLYYGDTELCLKVRYYGSSVVYTPFAKLLHQGSRTIKEYATAFFTVENYCHFIKKWPALKDGDPFYNSNLRWDYKINIEDDESIEKEFRAEKAEFEKLQDSLNKMYYEFLDSTYRELLYRPIDSGDLERYLPMLIKQELTIEDVRKIIRSELKDETIKIKDETIKIIDGLYRELLLRPADKQGLQYFGSLFENKNMTKEDIKKMILESEEVINIQKFSHYSAEYWNNLDEVNKYLNKLATGNEKTDWIEDMKTRFKQYLPFKKVLMVGCGNGWVERLLFDHGIGLDFDAFDASEEYITTAKQEKGKRPINYFVADVNNMKNIENNKYNAVFNYAILHHTQEIDYATKKLSQVLKPGGLMFNWEYVGPSRNQYTDEHLKIMKKVMSRLPEKLQSKHPLRPSIENFRVDPTEAIHSDLVRPTFYRYFDVLYERDLNGGIAYQILWNNISGFKDKSDKEAATALKMLLDEDLKLSLDKKVPILFWYGVGKPK